LNPNPFSRKLPETPESLDPSKLPKPEIVSLFSPAADIPVDRLTLPPTVSAGLSGYELSGAVDWDAIPEPKMQPSLRQTDLEWFACPKSLQEKCMLLTLPRILERYAYRGIGLKFLVAAVEWYIEHDGSLSALQLPALGSLCGTHLCPQVPVIGFKRDGGGIRRYASLASGFQFLNRGEWLIPAVHRLYFA